MLTPVYASASHARASSAFQALSTPAKVDSKASRCLRPWELLALAGKARLCLPAERGSSVQPGDLALCGIKRSPYSLAALSRPVVGWAILELSVTYSPAITAGFRVVSRAGRCSHLVSQPENTTPPRPFDLEGAAVMLVPLCSAAHEFRLSPKAKKA